MNQPRAIAIVGLAGRFPGAPSVEALWKLVAEGRSAAREIPAERWPVPAAEVVSSSGKPDTAKSNIACTLDAFELDLGGLELPEGPLSPLAKLTLQVGVDALRGVQVNRERTGAIIANIALPTEGISALSEEVMFSAAEAQLTGRVVEPRIEPLDAFPSAMPGGLLAQTLGLGGGSYTLDAACASSLFALHLGCIELEAGRLDAVLAGGVSLPQSLYTQIGFTQLQALSASGVCAPFGANADGLVVGEGAGMVVLKRLDDAVRDGDQIHGVIRGIGLSNDVGGSLLSPDSEGQLRAMRAAYAQAQWKPEDVQLVECHGTGTPRGDSVEVKSLATLWSHSTERVVIGSVKSNVGHLLTAAGMAGLTKMLQAMRHQQLPPSANVKATTLSPSLQGTSLDVLERPRAWTVSAGTPRRGAVSGFGFGGINAHVLIEEFTPAQPIAPIQKRADEAIAVVGVGVHVGKLATVDAFRNAMLTGSGGLSVRPESRWRGLAVGDLEQVSLGGWIDSLEIPVARFKVPPREIPSVLPQQLLMLQVASAAVEDAGGLGDGPHPRTGTVIGIGLDLETTSFQLRWTVRARAQQWAKSLGRVLTDAELDAWTMHLREALAPSLDAQRTLGALGGIVASRLARELSLGGPSFGVQSEETSGLRALEVAMRLLQRHEVDRMIVGAVDLAADVRRVLAADKLGRWSRGEVPQPFDELSAGAVPGEGASAVILKRLADAQRDGDRIYAVIRGIGAASGEQQIAQALSRAWAEAKAPATSARLVEATASGVAEEDAKELAAIRAATGSTTRVGSVAPIAGSLGAAAGLTSFVKAALSLKHHVLPRTTGAEASAWARNRSEGPRRAGVSSTGRDGTTVHVVLEQAPESATVSSAQAGHRVSGLFLLENEAAKPRLRVLIHKYAYESVDVLAARWHREQPVGRATWALVAESSQDLLAQLDAPSRQPARLSGEVAFVFPGSGAHFEGMGQSLHLALPQTLAALDVDSESLASHLSPPASDGLAEIIVRHVTHGLTVAEGLKLLGLKPNAYIGYSLGESAGLFSSRAWRDRDVMFRRTLESPLFRTQLGGPCTVVKDAWGPDAEWTVALVMRPQVEVRAALLRTATLLIVNAPRECVVGGRKEDVRAVVEKLGGEAVFLEGVPAVHMPLVEAVKRAYRDIHVLPATPPKDVRFYSAAWARPYEVTTDSAADSVTEDALVGFDFTKVIDRAWNDGVRFFVEAGPQGSCTRMISRILEGRPHVAVSACQRGQNGYTSLLKAIARVVEGGGEVSLEALYGPEGGVVVPAPKPDKVVQVSIGGSRLTVRAPERAQVHAVPPRMLRPTAAVVAAPVRELASVVEVSAPRSVSRGSDVVGVHMESQALSLPSSNASSAVTALVASMRATADAHEAFLQMAQQSAALQAQLLLKQRELLEGRAPAVTAAPAAAVPRFDRQQCLEFAIGSIGKMLGVQFASVDAHPTRVRLPDEPLMLVDRIVDVEGEPGGMGSGRVITEHDVVPGAWYLDGGRVPVCISVEAGQADLFLSAYLGIDLQTKGERVYRLLDAKVVFHRDLPQAGDVIRYDIRIDRFIKQGDTWLFFFRFDGTIDGQPLITMYDGCAGFFSSAQLEEGKGIVADGRVRSRAPRAVTAPFTPLLSHGRATLNESQVESLRDGNLSEAFGLEFPIQQLAPALRLPTGRMHLVDRILELDTTGGASSLGRVVGEHDVTPDAWYLTCHFTNDPVMPGTLMYECCLHTLRVLLLRLGWVDDATDVDLHYSPIEGVASQLKCRGQVLPSTKKVQYVLEINEIGYDPEPFVIATASMHADGKHIVQMEDMSVRIRGLTKERLDELYRSKPTQRADRFSRDQILEYCEGAPSKCFGPQYAMFDAERQLARLPRPPYLFMDRVLSCEPKPFELKPGGWITCEYDVPPDAWYFGANRQRAMPFAVLLEAALQPCGFLAAYAGSALESAENLKFRNLDGNATIHREVFADAGTLTLRSRLTKVSRAGGMILESFDFEVLARGEPVYTGTTGFGFFPKASLEQQVGIRGAQRFSNPAGSRSFELPVDAPFTPDEHALAFANDLSMPAKAFSMLGTIDALSLDGGTHGLGFVSGTKHVDPSDWFFRAHFFQDPVMPGSLGLEALIQTLKVWSRERFSRLTSTHRFQSLAVGVPHVWQYRGQVIPTNASVQVQANITKVVDGAEPLVVADGQFLVDGRVIYSAKDLTVRLVQELGR